MTIPEHIGLNHIQASIFGLLNQTFPHLSMPPFHKQNPLFICVGKKNHLAEENEEVEKNCLVFYSLTSGVLRG